MIFTLGMWGVGFGYGEQVMPGNPADFEFSKKIYDCAEKLFQEGKFKVHPVRVMEGGLGGTLEGLNELKSGKASGVKLVYKL